MTTAMNTVEMTRTQMNVLDNWMRNHAWERAEYLNKIGIYLFMDRPIKLNERGAYEQSAIMLRTSELEELILAEVAKIMGVSAVEKAAYPYMSEDIETILEIINNELDGWEVAVNGESLVVSRFFNSMREVWNQKLEGLVPVENRQTERRKVIIVADLETLNSNNFQGSSLADALSRTIGNVARVHDLMSFEQETGEKMETFFNEVRFHVVDGFQMDNKRPCLKCNVGTVTNYKKPVSIIKSPCSYDSESRSESGCDRYSKCNTCDFQDYVPADLTD
jgi:hypothetical protein